MRFLANCFPFPWNRRKLWKRLGKVVMRSRGEDLSVSTRRHPMASRSPIWRCEPDSICNLLVLGDVMWCHVMSCDVMWCHRSRHGSWGVWLPRSKQHGRSTTWRPDSSLLLLYIRLYTYTQSISKLTLSQLTIFVATASQCIAPPARSRTKQLLLFSFLFLTYVSGVGDEGRAWEFVQALRQPREPRGLCSNVGKTMPFLPTHLGMVKLPS